MSMSEVQEAAEVITGAVSPDANIIFGASIRPELQDEIIITVVATGFDSDYYREPEEEVYSNRFDNEPEEIRVVEEEKPMKSSEEAAKEFTAENKSNMWESITTAPEEDLDVPPSLRAKLRNRKK